MKHLSKSFYLGCGILLPIALIPHNVLAANNNKSSFYLEPETTDIDNSRNNNSFQPNLWLAQTDTNRDRFLQPTPDLAPSDLEKTEPIIPEAETEPQITPDEETAEVEFSVDRVTITGNTVLTDEELKPIIQSIQRRFVTLQQLEQAVRQITQLYIEKGYITSRAILPPQEVADGEVEIRAIEGSIADIEIEGNNRIGNNYIRKRLQLGTDTPVRVDRIEERLQLLKAGSLIDEIEANLQPAQGEGESNLVVDVDEANLWVLGANIDNYKTVSTGSTRAGVTLGYLDVTGNQDSLITSFNQSLNASSWSLDASYNLPVNAKDGTLQLRTNIDRNEIVGDDFESLDLEGDSELYEISFRQPIIKTLPKEFALSLGFSFQESQDFFNGKLLSDTERTSVFKFGQDYTSRDPKGVLALRSQFNFGVDIFNATNNGDDDTADGVFVSWLGQAQRLQRLSENNLLIIQGDLQLSSEPLLASQKFAIGGVQSVRGYRQNARLGDTGVRFSIEDRIAILKKENNPVLQLAPFGDLGVVVNSSDDNPDNNFLAGVGLGILVEPISGLNLRLDYAPPLVELDDRGDNIQEDGLYFSLNYRL